jgi:DivIVA domain-containing protein
MIYRAGERLGPYEVRAATFDTRWRGLDPDEVYAYLRQVADEMDRLLREAITAKTESSRIRQGLRQWQSRHVGCKFADPDPAPSPGPGPGANRRPGTGPDPDRASRNGGRW